MCYKSKPIIHNILGSRFVIYELSPVQLYSVFTANISEKKKRHLLLIIYVCFPVYLEV